MVSPHFPPDSSAATHRVRVLAPHLLACGWQPTVLAVDPSGYEGQLDPDLLRLVPETLEIVRVRAWRAAATRRLGFGDLGLRSLAAIWSAACHLLAGERFDAVYITTYPVYPAVLGPLLKRRFGIPFVLDYQDPWVGSWGRLVGGGRGGAVDGRSRAARAVYGAIERFVVKHADALTAVSIATYEDVLRRVQPAQRPACACLPIGCDAADFAGLENVANPCFDPRDGRVHVCYIGTLLPHGFDILRAVLEAVGDLRTRDPDMYGRLCLHFIGTSNQTSGAPEPRVQPIAQALGVADVVRERPLRLPYRTALRVLSDAAVVLVLGSNQRHYTASKLFPALQAGRPLLAVCHEASSIASLLRLVGRPPSVRLVTVPEGGVPDRHAIARELAGLIRQPLYVPAAVDQRALEAFSGRTLARTLGGLLDTVVRA